MTNKTRSELWPLYKAALITSPIIALTLVTPVFLVYNMTTLRITPWRFWLVWPLVTVAVFITWLIHIQFIQRFPQRMKWRRLVIVSLIMVTISTIGYFLVKQYIPVRGWPFQAMRVVNILSFNTMVYVISNYILLIRTKKKLDVENEQLKFANLEARYEVLHNQINPHFLFNSIGTAKSLIRKDPAIADEYLVKLSAFLRLGFDSKFDTVTVKEELALCADYIDLQQMRFDDALQFGSAIEEKYLSFRIPYFSILTLVENAVKHNTMTEEEPLKITIRNEDALLIVENNIQKKFLLETSSKTGLHNLSERYRLLFNEPVKVEEDESTFRVTIKMIRK
jgi:sensor histidine kinase YesM